MISRMQFFSSQNIFKMDNLIRNPLLVDKNRRYKVGFFEPSGFEIRISLINQTMHAVALRKQIKVCGHQDLATNVYLSSDETSFLPEITVLENLTGHIQNIYKKLNKYSMKPVASISVRCYKSN